MGGNWLIYCKTSEGNGELHGEGVTAGQEGVAGWESGDWGR